MRPLGAQTQKLQMLQAGVVDKEMDLPPGTFDYDRFVVGGGSGGAAAALEAARRRFVHWDRIWRERWRT